MNEANAAQVPEPIVIKNDSSTSTQIKLPSASNGKLILSGILMFLIIAGIGVGVFLARNRTQLNSQASSTPAVLSFNPPQTTIKPGEILKLTIVIDSKDTTISGAELYVSYNPEFLELKSFEKGTFLPNSIGQPETNPGSANLIILANPPNLNRGKGELATITFTALKSTSTPTEVTIDSSKTQIRAQDNPDNLFGSAQKAAVTISDLVSSSAEASSSAVPKAGIATLTSQTEASQSSTPSEQDKDFNGDGKINSIDLSYMYSGWGTPKTDQQKKAELNGDGIINGIDYSLFLPSFKP
jgi:hypothetical protein